MPWLDDVTAVLAKVERAPEGAIDIASYLVAMDAFPPIYDLLFMGVVAGQLKGDIVGKATHPSPTLCGRANQTCL